MALASHGNGGKLQKAVDDVESDEEDDNDTVDLD